MPNMKSKWEKNNERKQHQTGIYTGFTYFRELPSIMEFGYPSQCDAYAYNSLIKVSL